MVISKRHKMPLMLSHLITRKLFSSGLSLEHTEKIVVPTDKPFVTLSGTKASDTIITWNDGGGIFDSPTLSVLASDFVGRYLTIQNTFGTSGRAVAVRVSGDKAASSGATDFTCGNAASRFERCHLHSMSERGGAITAQHRAMERLLRVIFALTYMSNAIMPHGWDDWGNQSTHRWKSVEWCRSLSNEEAAPFLTKDMIGGKDWLRPQPNHFKRSSTLISTL
ncbi:hypothetical protein FNV43_RR22809 [Rhamnella rubrinervis]|uniref:pectinesterase n=1 Tax=Rhamnella rubrinervis TaxID=2594499 RepID=A0A8K0GNJ2_9ROSA|nr:hypothetical protein FNV43_RR22809 [Rhamnella rubrinervis]